MLDTGLFASGDSTCGSRVGNFIIVIRILIVVTIMVVVIISFHRLHSGRFRYFGLL